MAAAREPLPGAAQPLSGAASCPVSLSTRPAALGCSLGVPGRHQEAALCAFGGLRFCVRVVHPSISLVDHSLVVMIRDLLEILFPAKRTHPRLGRDGAAGGTGNRGTRVAASAVAAVSLSLSLSRLHFDFPARSITFTDAFASIAARWHELDSRVCRTRPRLSSGSATSAEGPRALLCETSRHVDEE